MYSFFLIQTIVQDSSPTQEIGGDKQSRIDLNNFPSNPGLRKGILTYHATISKHETSSNAVVNLYFFFVFWFEQYYQYF